MKKEKTIYELAQEFPNKTYRELEIYRDADRQEEAQQIPLTESQQKQEELEPIAKGVCVTGALRKDRETEILTDHYEKEIWKLKELLSKAMQDTNTLDGTKRVVIDLSKEKTVLRKRAQESEEGLANALAVNESHQKMNGKLQERLTELEEENKKLHEHVDRQVSGARKSGM